MGDTGKTPWGVLLDIWFFVLQGVYLGIDLDVLDVGVSSDLLDGFFIEVTGVAHQTWDIVCVPKTLVDLLLKAYLASLLELGLHRLLLVDILYPAVVGLCTSICYMALEDDHVVVGDGLRVRR